MKRSALEDRHMENDEDSDLDPKYDTDLNSLKALNLKHIDDNGEIPCDTCGGKNKRRMKSPEQCVVILWRIPKAWKVKSRM